MRFKEGDVKVSCYRYAPEQFQATYKNKRIELSFDEISTCGNLLLCKGYKQAVDEIKRILRKREKQKGNGKSFTYGFYVKDSTDTYIYCESCIIGNNSKMPDKYREYKFIKQDLARRNATVQTSWSAEIIAGKLSGQEKGMSTVDLTRPIKIFFRYA